MVLLVLVLLFYQFQHLVTFTAVEGVTGRGGSLDVSAT